MARTATKPAPTTPGTSPAPQAAPEDTQPELVTLTGRLVADPVLRRTQSKLAVANFRIAVNHDDGATFHSCVAWKRTAETVAQYLKKGRLVEVRGFERNRTWTDKDGNARTSVEISAVSVQFLGRTQQTPKAADEQVA